MFATRAVACIALINLLDLSTSLSRHGSDLETPLPARPAWLLAVQWLLLGVLPFFVRPAWCRLRSLLLAMRAPTWAKYAIAALACMQVAHVLFRAEHYPFSAVTMFSNYLPRHDPGRARALAMFVVDGERGAEPVSLLREGNPWFARHLQVDYKAGWIYGTFAQHDEQSTRRVADLLARAGARNPRLVRLALDPSTGAITLPSLLHASARP